MRFRSPKDPAGRVFAVSGVNTVSFGIATSSKSNDGLLGFAVERVDASEHERYFMPGFKVFRSVVPHPDAHTQVSTREHPVQSFVWDDFTAKPDHEYEYRFHPVKGTPKNLDHRSDPLTIKVRTEPLISDLEHDVFFNRGVASSQAYQRRFGRTPIASLKPKKKQKEALAWLSRELGTAVLRFIGSCESGDRLLCCFYEFRYEPVADALAAAIKRGVDVRIIVDAKVNESTDEQGRLHPSFPREDNFAMIAKARIPKAKVVLREARANDIQHNKFMVRIAPGHGPIEVWTGSTNMSPGGISGQTNVGHWVRNPDVATQFARYWDLLATDPGGATGDTRAEATRKNKAFQAAVEQLSPATDLGHLPKGTTALFSPRLGDAVLHAYGKLLDGASGVGCITLAFGISSVFKDLLKDNTSHSQLVFILLEKKDQPNPRSKTAFVAINASNNVYKAWGSFLQDPVYQWARETNAGLLGLNQHVRYIHSKFLLVDPLSDDPTVVTGSANFSVASTRENDENMIVVRGDRRTADIYFTEFNRLFNHYYFRSVTEDVREHHGRPGGESLFLVETPEWQKKYAPGGLKAKRLALYAEMSGFTNL